MTWLKRDENDEGDAPVPTSLQLRLLAISERPPTQDRYCLGLRVASSCMKGTRQRLPPGQYVLPAGHSLPRLHVPLQPPPVPVPLEYCCPGIYYSHPETLLLCFPRGIGSTSSPLRH